MIVARVPGARRHEMPLRRTGTVTETEFEWVPDLRRIVARCAASGTRGLYYMHPAITNGRYVVARIRQDFPALAMQVYGKKLVYLDIAP